MSRQQFRLLVVFDQLLGIALIFVEELTEGLLPPDVRSALGVQASVLDADEPSGLFLSELPFLLDTTFTFVHVVAAVGLCLGRRWGRTLFVVCFVGVWLLTPFYAFFLMTQWTAMLAYLYGATEGMILALVFFSHLRRMFQPARDGDENALNSPA